MKKHPNQRRRKKRYLILNKRKYRIKSKASDHDIHKGLVDIIKQLTKRKGKKGVRLARKGRDFIAPQHSAGSIPLTEEQLARYRELAELNRQQAVEQQTRDLDRVRREEEREHAALLGARSQPISAEAIAEGVAERLLMNPPLLGWKDPEAEEEEEEVTHNSMETGLKNYELNSEYSKLKVLWRKLTNKPLPKIVQGEGQKKRLMQELFRLDPNFRLHVEAFAFDNTYPSKSEVKKNLDAYVPQPIQEGSGLEDGKPGLYNTEIAGLMRRYRGQGFLGVFSIDQMGDIHPQPDAPHCSFILNTVPHNVRYGHFVGVWVDNTPGHHTLEYYDPFGALPSKAFMSGIRSVLVRVGMGKQPVQFKVNRVRYQSVKSANCGFFSMRFLQRRFAGEPFKEASGFTKYKGVERSEKGIDAYAHHIQEFGHLTLHRRGAGQEGGSITDKFISALPFELHLFGTNERTGKTQRMNFAGPGTKLKKRLNADDTPKDWSIPINDLDKATYYHDLAYREHTDAKGRNEADRELIRRAEEFEKKPGISKLDKVDAKIVEVAMKLIKRKE